MDGGGVSIRDGQDKRPIPAELLERLARCGERSLRLIQERYLERVKAPGVVSIALIDDREIARVHAEFMNDPTPTDVITFPYGAHGEILISIETAERQAVEYGASFERELALYVVHGMLHLCGYEDRTEGGREEMEGLQEALLQEVFGEA